MPKASILEIIVPYTKISKPDKPIIPNKPVKPNTPTTPDNPSIPISPKKPTQLKKKPEKRNFPHHTEVIKYNNSVSKKANKTAKITTHTSSNGKTTSKLSHLTLSNNQVKPNKSNSVKPLSRKLLPQTGEKKTVILANLGLALVSAITLFGLADYKRKNK